MEQDAQVAAQIEGGLVFKASRAEAGGWLSRVGRGELASPLELKGTRILRSGIGGGVGTGHKGDGQKPGR